MTWTVLLSGSADYLLLNNLAVSGVIMIRGPSKKMDGCFDLHSFDFIKLYTLIDLGV